MLRVMLGRQLWEDPRHNISPLQRKALFNLFGHEAQPWWADIPGKVRLLFENVTSLALVAPQAVFFGSIYLIWALMWGVSLGFMFFGIVRMFVFLDYFVGSGFSLSLGDMHYRMAMERGQFLPSYELISGIVFGTILWIGFIRSRYEDGRWPALWGWWRQDSLDEK